MGREEKEVKNQRGVEGIFYIFLSFTKSESNGLFLLLFGECPFIHISINGFFHNSTQIFLLSLIDQQLHGFSIVVLLCRVILGLII